MKRTWDIFCSVIDNFGDIGICWRLARQLSSITGNGIRLWVDDLPSFRRLCHAVDPERNVQRVRGVEIRQWGKAFPAVTPSDIVIEGFGVRLPDSYIEAMAAQLPHPVWINFEYLSAESWVEGCHGLPSPHPTMPLVKYFFFPGYTPATGGLIVEEGLAQARDAFQQDPAALAAFRHSLGIDAPPDTAIITVSLFCYENAALPALVEAWESGSMPVVCVAPDGVALRQLSHITGVPLAAGNVFKRGSLAIHAIGFLEQDAYERLLWASEFNFVRGEDSFVRAQLAGRPLIWQAYPQEEEAHLRKTAAFLESYADTLTPVVRQSYRAFSQAWNRES